MSSRIVFFSRFPILFEGGRSAGVVSLPIQYPRGSAVVLSVAPPLKRRYVVNGKAINPSTLQISQTPRYVYTYPSMVPEPIHPSLSYGVVLKTAARNGLFVPLAPIVTIRKEDTKKLLDIATMREKKIDIEAVLRGLGVEVLERVQFMGSTGYRIHDPEFGIEYDVIVGSNGEITDTNVCYHGHGHTIVDLVLQIKERMGDVYLYRPLW